jgi:DNA-directed RNA polymerase specialized sigma24 family protein
MQYFPEVSDFISHNQSQIKKITYSVCFRYRIKYVEDVLQDVYEAMIRRNTMGTFDPNHPSATKISTYLYNLVRNIAVRNYKKSNESIIEQHHFNLNYSDLDYIPEDDFATEENLVSVNYENILNSNQISEEIDGLNLDLNLFEEYLQKRDKFYLLNKRKNKEVITKGLSLLMIFKLMRQGYKNQDIAAKFGVTKMFITSLKVEIKKQLIKFGIYWKESKYRSPKKRFFSDSELNKYAEELLLD